MADFADMIEDALGSQSCETSWVRAPRWMGIPGFITKLARANDLELVRMAVEKRYFYMKASYTVRGPQRKVDAFKIQVGEALTHFGALEQG